LQAEYIFFEQKNAVLVAEYLNSAMSSFPGITVIERERLYDIINEQKFQLSGLTDDESVVEVSNLLNAKQMVVGSFLREGDNLTVSGRIVDVEGGTVLSSESISAGYDNNLPQITKRFVFQLLAKLPEYEITIPFKAKINTIEDRDSSSDENYAKALEALFNNDEVTAMEFLERSVSGASLNNDAVNQYIRTSSSVYAQDLYKKMIEEQVKTNTALISTAEELSVYRNTIKVLIERMYETITPESFVIEVGKDESIELGKKFARIKVPAGIKISMDDSVKKEIQDYLKEQDIVYLKSNKILFKKKPETGQLLPSKGAVNMFKFGINSKVCYSIQFLDIKGM